MTAYWADSPFPRLLRPDEIDISGDSLGSGGESSGVHRLAPPRQEWVFKRYTKPVPSAPLAGLIAHPQNFSPQDITTINRHTAWPVARVEERPGQSIGVIMPAAPEPYWATVQLPSGRSRRQLLELDQLARATSRQKSLGLPGQELPDRLAACASFTTTAALFEQAGLVYLDWSFANVLWSTADHSTYVIDVDGATFGPRQQIGSHMFDDPLVPMRASAGVEVDRYRVALLVAWCITGRSPDRQQMLNDIHLLSASNGPAAPIAMLINRTLDATQLGDRIALHHLRDALQASIRRTGPSTTTTPRPDVSSSQATITWKPIGAKRPAAVPGGNRAGSNAPAAGPPKVTLPARQPTPGPAKERVLTPAPAPIAKQSSKSSTATIVIVVSLILLAIFIFTALNK